jgi:RND family efflux transporter MFP subunit
MPSISTSCLVPSARGTAAPTRRAGRLAAWGLVLWVAVTLAPAAWADGPAVPVTTVVDRAVDVGFTLDGRLEAVRQSVLSAQASGRVVRLLVKAGDRVRAGQVLALIDDRATRAGLAQAQATVAQADAQLAQARAAYERARELQARGFVAQAALDAAQAQWRAAEAAATAARAGQAQAALAQGYTRLEAPYDGWVLATHLEVGALAAPGVPVVTVYAHQPLRAVVHVPASQQPLARLAQRVRVRLPDDGRWVEPAAVTPIPAVDATSQTVEWRVELAPGGGAGQVPGRQVQVRFEGGQARRLAVPASAVLRRGELTAVYVVAPPARDGEPGRFVLRAVRVGADHGEAGVEIVAGLKGGERVALDPVRAGLAGARPQTP